MSVYMEVTPEQIAAIYAMTKHEVQTDRGITYPTGQDIAEIFSTLVSAIESLTDDDQYLMYGTDRGLLVYRDVSQPGFYQLAMIVGGVHIESTRDEGDECAVS